MFRRKSANVLVRPRSTLPRKGELTRQICVVVRAPLRGKHPSPLVEAPLKGPPRLPHPFCQPRGRSSAPLPHQKMCKRASAPLARR